MTFNFKRIYSYLCFALAGLFNLVFMFMNYSVYFMKFGDESENAPFSAYKMIDFTSDESLFKGFNEIMDTLFDEPAIISFLLILVAIIMIFVIIASVVLLCAGVIGLIKEMANVKALSFIENKAIAKASAVTFTVNFALHIASAFFLIIVSLFSIKSEEVFGYKISIGLRPGLGMYFLLVVAVGLWVANLLLKKKLPAVPATKTVYRCPACDNVSEEAVEACPVCGAPVNAEAVEVEEEANAVSFDFGKVVAFVKNVWVSIPAFLEKNQISKKTLSTAGIAVGAVILALIVLAIVPKPQKYAYLETEQNVLFTYDAESEKTSITVNGKVTKFSIDGQIFGRSASLCGETYAIRDSEGTLYAFTGKKLTKVAEDVDTFRVSADGTGIAFTTTEGELIVYDVKKNKQSEIDDEIGTDYYENYGISPDGNSVAYVKTSDDKSAAYIWTNGKKEKFGNDIVIFGLSEKAKLVYYYDYDKQAAYVQKGSKDPVKLVSGDPSSLKFAAFNADGTEIFYATDNGWYISADGKEKVKVTSKDIEYFGNYGTFATEIRNMFTDLSSLMPVETFAEQYILLENGDLGYISKKFEFVKVADDVDEYKATPSYSYVYYLDGDTLYRGEGYKEKFKEVADDVDSFVITNDGNGCYFVDTDDTLSFVKKTGKAKKISDDVEGVAMSHDGYAFFEADDVLYSSRNGSKKKKIAEDIDSFAVLTNVTYYAVENEDDEDCMDIYSAKSKTKFKCIIECAQSAIMH